MDDEVLGGRGEVFTTAQQLPVPRIGKGHDALTFKLIRAGRKPS